MLKLKTIRLYPTLFSLDVFLGGKQSEVESAYEKRYGLKLCDISKNECSLIHSGKDCELKKTIRIAVRIQTLDRRTVEHEAMHVLHYLSRESGVEIHYESQEWNACFIEYVISEIVNKNNYVNYE